MASRALLVGLVLATFPAWGAEVAGIKLEDKTTVANADLTLTGAGLRKRLFFQVYAIGLYVQDRKADPIVQPGPKRVHIHMLRDVGAEQFTEALVDGIKANHTEAEAKALEPRLKQLGATMAQLKEAKSGMAIALEWTGKETLLAVDGKPAGAPIPGEDFYRALLRIWLGENPVQDELKKALAGG
jgi:Chalcone isomerase-like